MLFSGKSHKKILMLNHVIRKSNLKGDNINSHWIIMKKKQNSILAYTNSSYIKHIINFTFISITYESPNNYKFNLS